MLRVTDRLWTAIDNPGMGPERARYWSTARPEARFIRQDEGPPLETGAPYLAQQLTTDIGSGIGTGIGIAVGLSVVGVAIWAVSEASRARR
jgi:hypothetical protein